MNATLEIAEVERCCPLTLDAREALRLASRRLTLSGRAYHRVLRVARTIADLQGAEVIAPEHVLEAAGYCAVERSIGELAGTDRAYVSAREGVTRLTESTLRPLSGPGWRQ